MRTSHHGENGLGGRVVFCVQNLGVPQDRRVWREARTLAAAGYSVTVIAPRETGQASHEILGDVGVLRYPALVVKPGLAGQVAETAWALAWTAWLLLSLRVRGRIDVLHAANPPDTYFLLGRLLALGGTRFVYDQHDLCPELLTVRNEEASRPSWLRGCILRTLFQMLERGSYRAASLVIAPNESYRRIALGRGGVEPDAVVVVRSGPDRMGLPPGSAERSTLGRGPLVVAFAGVMGRQDRLDVLLSAAAEVLERRPGVLRIDLIGSGDDVPRLRELATTLGIEASVAWAGWLTGDDLDRRLGSADVAVSLDDDNAFSRLSTMTKVPEYLALGLPSLIADLPENRVSAEGAALYFEPGDHHQLAKRLDELIDDNGLLDDLRRAALHRAPQLLWEHSAQRLLGAYRWLLQGEAVVEDGAASP